MELNNLTELELYFADHFDTVLFSVLAEIYQSKGEYDRAKRYVKLVLNIILTQQKHNLFLRKQKWG